VSETFPVLSVLTWLPAGVAALIALVRLGFSGPAFDAGVKAATLMTTLATFALSLFVLAGYDQTAGGFQFVEAFSWFGAIQYKLGVDGLSVALVVLTTFLVPLCIIASLRAVTERVSAYMIAFLLLETLMIGVFCALDLVLFYLFFEGGLIPMFLIIGIWGGKNRIYAAFKFFLYTLLGSLLMLVAVIVMYVQTGTTDIVALQTAEFAPGLQTWLWLAFAASFAVKLPMFPVHTWLPDAHVEAPTAGSVILAGVLLKMGGYGFLRFSLPMFPDASVLFQPAMLALSVVAIVYASLVAFRQTDMKKLIAYSSVAHMGFVTLGIFSFTVEGLQGAVFQMISHGVISSALFLIVGVVYDRMHTREIAAYGGLVHRMPVYAAMFMVFSMANVGLPGTSGFVGEFMTLAGGFQASTLAAVGATLGVIFSAVYMLTLYRRTVFGELNPAVAGIQDVSAREVAVLAPLVVLTLLLGVAPGPVLALSQPLADTLAAQFAGLTP
jgi:NADH-quinone oxidoreductase subunit M